MEFFREINYPNTDIAHLQAILPIRDLPTLCKSIDRVITDNGNDGEIYTVWGQFLVRRELLKHGVRFTLPYCPNAFVWTIGYNEQDAEIVVHCTIDRKSHDQDFIDSIHQFMDEWVEGLGAVLSVGL